MFKTIKNAWSLPDLRKKILFTLLIIVVFRIGSVIQVPFLDTAALRSVMNPDDWSNTMLSYMNTLSGGAFSNATLFAMGITPYINSSIIIQLLCVAIPPLERLAREGEAGRRKISAITRYVTVGLGIIQGTAYYFYLLNSKVTLYNSGFELWFSAIVIILVFTAGTAGGGGGGGGTDQQPRHRKRYFHSPFCRYRCSVPTDYQHTRSVLEPCC